MLLADEPTGELDSSTALTIYQAFRELCRRYGVTTLIVSHDPKIARHVDRVVAIRDGKLAGETVRRVQVGAPTEKDQPVHEEHFEEYAVLDSAGRLQLPKELREQYGIKERARLEPAEAGILVRAVQRQVTETASPDGNVQIEKPVVERRGLKALFSRLTPKSKSKG